GHNSSEGTVQLLCAIRPSCWVKEFRLLACRKSVDGICIIVNSLMHLK
uniref:Uncharacterized protein n=1 Tax=Aegilops tauschii subsp. strangulata TaxID=200361 RepID=A0A452XVV5_AEGTS